LSNSEEEKITDNAEEEGIH